MNATQTKGQIIFNQIENVMITGEFKTRKDIAADAGSVVSRVSEILTQFNDEPAVIAYRHLDEFFKIQAKYAAAA